MDCHSFRETFSGFLDGLLDEEADAQARAHLAACPPCRRMESAYRAGIAALQAVSGVRPPRAFAARILHRVRNEPVRPSPVGAYSVAGALLAVAAVGIFVLDVQETRQVGPARSLSTRVEAVAPPREPAADAPDVVTLRLADDLIDVPAPHPLAPAHVVSSASLLHFEITAAWAGR